jgi:N-acyl-D-amino-acid deacylase
VLFDPRKVGLSGLQRVKDLPGGGTRMMRAPVGVHGVWVNGLQVFDGVKYSPQPDGPGRVLRIFDS